MFIRLGTPSGFSTTSTGRPSSRNGMSSSGTIFAITPLLPWRPASLSPSAILRFLATYTRTSSFTPGERSSPFSRENVLTSMTLPPSPCGTFSEVSRTSRAFSLKIARISFSSAVSSVSPFGVTLPTSRSPELTSAPMRTTPRSSRSLRDSSERFGMSRVISSSPSFVERASISYSWMWIEERTSSLTSRSELKLAHVGRAAVREHLLRPHLVAERHDRLVMDQRALVRAHELRQRVLVLAVLRLHRDVTGVDVGDRAGAVGEHDVTRIDGGAILEAGAHDRRLGDHQWHCLLLHVRAHQRAVRVVVLEERDQRGRDGHDLRRRDVHELDVLRLGSDRLAFARAAEHLLVVEAAGFLVDDRACLRDRELGLFGRVEIDDLVRHLAANDLAVRGLDEAELGHGRHRGERADQADVRALRRLDRAHAPVVGRVNVAHLDRRALAREPARAERRQAAAVRQAGKRVRLVHELRQLRGAEELLHRRHDRPDVDDRLRRDRVHVLGRHPLAHDTFHAVEPDAERLLDQLADGAEPAVAEVLVLVELGADRIAVKHDRIGCVVLRV